MPDASWASAKVQVIPYILFWQGVGQSLWPYFKSLQGEEVDNATFSSEISLAPV